MQFNSRIRTTKGHRYIFIF